MKPLTSPIITVLLALVSQVLFGQMLDLKPIERCIGGLTRHALKGNEYKSKNENHKA
jgi:hypothetical protein